MNKKGCKKIFRMKLKEPALVKENSTKLIESFGSMEKYGDNPVEQAEKKYSEIFSKISKVFSETDKNVLYNGGSSIRSFKLGFDIMFDIMKNNREYAAAPRDANEREELYRKLANGLNYIADLINAKYSSSKMNDIELVACLSVIGEGGYACASRWRQVLEEVIQSFSDEIKKDSTISIDNRDKLEKKLSDIFFDARVAVSNKTAEEFVETNFSDVSVAVRLHYISAFKRYLNADENYNLPISMEQDSYIMQHMEEIEDKAKKFVFKVDINNLVVERAINTFVENVKSDEELINKVIDWASACYKRNKGEFKKEYSEFSEFLSEEIFNGYTYELRNEGVKKLLQDKGYFEMQGLPNIISFNIEKKRYSILKDILTSLSEQDIRNILPILNTPHEKNGEPILNSAIRDHETEFAKMLIDLGVDINLQYEFKDKPIYLAVRNNMDMDIDIVKALVEKTPDSVFEMKDNYGMTLLCWAVLLNNADVVKALVGKTPDSVLKKQNNEGKTLLHWAAFSNDVKIVKALVGKTPDSVFEMKGDDGMTPLHWAVYSNNAEKVKALVGKTPDSVFEMKDNEGRTPLHWAVYNENAEIVKALLEKTPDSVFEMKDNKGMTLIKNTNKIEIRKLIRERCKADTSSSLGVRKLITESLEPKKNEKRGCLEPFIHR